VGALVVLLWGERSLWAASYWEDEVLELKAEVEEWEDVPLEVRILVLRAAPPLELALDAELLPSGDERLVIAASFSSTDVLSSSADEGGSDMLLSE
jgi:hypothetical protein